MCRWLAYCGEPLRPSVLILDPQHSLIAQSLDSSLRAETVTVLDGSGYYHQPFLAGER
jgi:glutamine amidotransferase